MSVDEYRKQVRDPAITRDQDDENFRKELSKRGIGLDVKDDVDKPKRQHVEDDHTEMVAQYLEILMMEGKVIEYTHTANETWDPGWKQKARNKTMGVRSGIPDFIIVFKKSVLFLELKRPDGGVISPTQKKWISALQWVGGNVTVRVAYGFDQAKLMIDNQIRITT